MGSEMCIRDSPPQTDPNQAEPCKGSEPLLARRPYVARGTHGARTVPHRKRPHTRHASRAPGRVRRQGAERSHMHGHMYSDSLGAAAGCAPERSSLGGGVPSVGNAGFVGRVIQLAAVLRVTRIRLRRAVEHAVQRRVPAPRDLPERLAMKVRPRPVRVPAARLRRPVLIKVKIKKKKPTQLSTLNHTHDTAPQRDSSTHHTPLHHSKVHPPHAAGWRTKSKMTQ